MTGLLGKTTNLQSDIIGRMALSEREAMWGPIPGEVVSYDTATGTAEVRPLYRPRHNGKPVDMPNLLEVPVDLPRTANAGMTFPIPPGTKVMLTPSMRSMENYDTDNDGEASDGRSFNLSDMRASLSGGDSLSSPLPNVDPDNTHLRFDADGQFGIRGSPDGKIKIEGAHGDIYRLLAEAIRLIGSDQLQIAYGSSAGSGHALANRAAILAIADKLDAMALD